jgi:hypothetical protein
MRPVALLGLLLILFASAVAAGQAPLPLRFVDQNGSALPNARLRVLCFANPSADQVLADRWIVTNTAGFPAAPLPSGCAYLAALHLRHTQPSGKAGRSAAYFVFNSSFAPGTSSALPALGDVVLRDEWSLILFDVAASLEWQPAVGDAFLAELHAGLRDASAYLYDLSEGQMAFGALRIDTAGANWESADLRFRAANDYRPSARIGGIVAARQAYNTTGGKSVTFTPGDVLFGRYWSGRSAADAQRGAWDQPNAYRTIAHEWGHYALFLYDSYRQASTAGIRETYCTCRDLPLLGRTANACNGLSTESAASAMSYHYSASEFWLNGAPPECANTDQARLHGASDWATLARWSAIQGLPQEWLGLPAELAAGPTPGIVVHLFGTTPAAGEAALFLPIVAATGDTSAEPVRTLPISIGLDAGLDGIARAALAPQVYTVGERAIYQGTSDNQRDGPQQLGGLSLLGLRDERLVVQLDRYGPGGARYRFDGAAATPIQLSVDSWQASVDLQAQLETQGISALDLFLTSKQSLTTAPTVALCTPGDGCGAAQSFSADAQGRWRAQLLPLADGALPSYGLLRIEAPGQGKMLRWYLLGGGLGPAHIRGDAPLVDGLLNVDGTSEDPRAQLLFMPAANIDALQAALPNDIVGIIGQPLDIDIAHNSTGPLSFTLSLAYDLDQIAALGVDAAQLRILYFDRLAQAWLPVPVAAFSPALPAAPQPTPLPTLTTVATERSTVVASETATPSATITGTVVVTKTVLAQQRAQLVAEDEAGWFWVASHPLSRDGIYALAWAP